MKLERMTIYMRPAIADQLRRTAKSLNRSVSGLVHDCLVQGIASAYAGSEQAEPFDIDEIWGREK